MCCLLKPKHSNLLIQVAVATASSMFTNKYGGAMAHEKGSETSAGKTRKKHAAWKSSGSPPHSFDVSFALCADNHQAISSMWPASVTNRRRLHGHATGRCCFNSYPW